MHQLLLSVLLAVFAVSSYTHSIPQKNMVYEPDMPMEIESDVDELYPEEYMDKLWASLTPKQKEYFTIDINLKDREGPVGSQHCDYGDAIRVIGKTRLRAVDDRRQYFVIQPTTVPIQVCKYSGSNSCHKDAPIKAGEKGCCIMREKMIEMSVLPYDGKGNKCIENCGDLVKKNMTLATTCDCHVVITDAQGDTGSAQCKKE